MQEERREDRYLTIQEVSERLKVCRASIYLWLKKGFPQPLKLGRTSRWSASELDEWLKTRPRGAYGEKDE